MKITLNRTISFLLALAMVVAMLPAFGTLKAYANGPEWVRNIEEVSCPEPGKIYVRGWAADKNAPATSVEIRVYVGGSSDVGEGHYLGPTTVFRRDVNENVELTGNHGFECTFDTEKYGNQEVYVYVDIEGVSPVLIGGPISVYVSPPKPAYGDQHWNLSKYDYCPEKPDGVYRIASAANPNYSLDIFAGGETDGTNLHLYANGETDAQLFHLRRVSYQDIMTDFGLNETRTIVSLMNIKSQRFLDKDAGSNNVHQYGTLPNYKHRQWIMHNNGDGTYSFESVVQPGWFMTIVDGKIENGKNIAVASPNLDGKPTIYQKFYLNAEYVHGDNRLGRLDGFLKTGEYRLWTSSAYNRNDTRVLDIPNASKDKGTQAQIWTAGDAYSLHQIFDIRKAEEGWYTIRNISSGLYLAAASGAAGRNLDAVQQLNTNSDAAKWAFVPRVRTDGTLSYWIVNKATGLYLFHYGNDDGSLAVVCSVDNSSDKPVGNASALDYDWRSWGMEACLSVAPEGTVINGATGIAADQFDITDTISLPIKIYDYNDDGLLFEYSLVTEHNNGGFSLVVGSTTAKYPSWTIGQTTFGKGNFPENQNNFVGSGQFWNSSPDGLNNMYMVVGSETDLEYLAQDQLLGYSFYGEMISGSCTMGLVKPTLREVDGNRLMEYNDEVVAYVADLLDWTLTYREQYEKGEIPLKNDIQDVPIGKPIEAYGDDMAKLLLTQLKAANGDVLLRYSNDPATRRQQIYNTLVATYGKQDKLIGTWNECKEHITTYTDAAYFILNNLFYPASYNMPQDKFDYLVLSKATLTNGKTAYVFDSDFSDTYNYVAGTTKSAVKYDFTAKTIFNTSMLGKPFERTIQVTSGSAHYTFLPVWESEGVQIGINNPYKVETVDFTNKNYNYVLQCNGKFTYNESEGLFFDFEGDDDVYLFINGQLVLDIGGAHGATAINMNLNDYVYAARAKVAAGTATDRDRALALVDGEEYSFDFYYMERHTSGANMRIATNIRVSDPNLDTDKKAYQGGLELNNGGLVNADENVEYSFKLSNPANSISNLYHLTFADAKLGVTIDSANGLTVSGSKTLNSVGTALTAADLKIYFTNQKGETSLVTLDGSTAEEKNEALKTYLAQVNGKGLRPGCSIEIRGIYYNIEKSDFVDGRFTNTLHVTANQNADGSGDTYQDSVNMVVCMATGPQYYQWSGQNLSVDKEKFVTDVNALLKEGSALQLQIAPATSLGTVTNLELCDMKGNVVPNSHVTASADGISINYSKPGNYVFYVKVTQSDNSSVIIPMQVYVVGVPESVYVLDYGLKVDLGNLFTAKDTLSVAGKATEYTIEALTVTEPSYENNGISFPDAIAIADEKMEINGTYGVFTYENGCIEYQPNAFIQGPDSIYFAVRVYEGTPGETIGTVNINKEVEMYKAVTILPATSVYYEDNFVELTETTITESKNENDETVKMETVKNGWTTVGSASTDTQDADVPGVNPNKVYGYDTHYTNMTTYSYGSAMKTTVTAGKYATARFSFWGTGFDVISMTSNETGVIVVKISDAGGNYVANYLVDTYYGYKFDGENWIVDTQAKDNALYQVPVIKVNLNSVVKTKDNPDTTDVDETAYWGYGQYKVEIIASYAPLFDHGKCKCGTTVGDQPIKCSACANSSECSCTAETCAECFSYDFYLDAIRIYNPVEGNKADDAYIADNEYLPTFEEIRDKLINQETFGSLTGDETISGAVFIDGTASGTIADYEKFGPNSEVYLQKNQAVVFDLLGENLGSVQIGMKSNGSALVTIYGLDGEGVKTTAFENKAINTATELYYAITSLVGKTIVIKNVGNGILSLTNLKTTAAVTNSTDSESEMVISQTGVNLALASLEGKKDPIVSEGTIAPQSATLTYEDEILLNIYFTMEGIEASELGLMTYTADGSTLLDTIPGAVFADGQYMATTRPIAAKNLGDTVYFRVYAKLADGSYVYSKLLSYSPKTYAMNILNNSDDVAMKALVVAMLNYGAEAQKYFGYKTEALVNADLTAEQKALVADYSAGMIAPLGKVDSAKVGAFAANGGFGKKYPTVSLEGAFAINYHFENSYAMNSGMTLYYWSAEDYANAEVLTAENATGIVNGTTVSGIAAKDLNSTIYVAAVYESNGTSYCTGVLPYSVGAFCASDGSALAQAIAVYGNYAQAFFG